jgi:NAD(P)-dependent dehydrogenase (short-subunit alcohol dehydrogenase family)
MNKREGDALITGGNSGIGLATAKQFVNEERMFSSRGGELGRPWYSWLLVGGDRDECQRLARAKSHLQPGKDGLKT